MVEGNFDKMLEKVASIAGLSTEELKRRVEAKRAKLSGLISEDGALQVIAAELGVSFDNERFKIDELLPGMRKVNVVGKIINLFPVREFTTKAGEPGKVVNFILADDGSNIKVVLWDTNHIALIEKGTVKQGSVVELLNGSVKDNEIHLGSFSEVKLSSEVMNNVQEKRIVKEKSIEDFSVGDNISVRAFVVAARDPKFFNVCSECRKKVEEKDEGFFCAEHGGVRPEKRALIGITIDDGTENIKATIFHENLSSIGLTSFEDENLLLQQKENVLGKEMVFSGSVRMNSYFNEPELIISSADEVELDQLLGKLESN